MRWLRLLVSLCLVGVFMPVVALAAVGDVTVTSIDSQRVGIGGGGALFDPAVSPFNINDMAVGSDMGDIFVTRDGGKHWSKKTVGLAYDIVYDPTRQGTVYVCGSGIWRSTDYGEHFSLMWPKAEHVTGVPMKYEDFRYYLFNTDGYNQASSIVSVAVDRADNNTIYALAYQTRYDSSWNAIGPELVLHRSTDNGDTFTKLDAVLVNLHGNTSFTDNSEVFVHDGTVWVSTRDCLYYYDETSSELKELYRPDGTTYYSILDIVQTTSDGTDGLTSGKDYFWIAEGLDTTSLLPRSSLRRFYVKDDGTLEFTDFTADMNDSTKGLNRTNRKTGTDIDIRIRRLAAPSSTRVYFTVSTFSDDNTLLGRYDATYTPVFKWVIGRQFPDLDGVQLNDDVPGRYDLQNLGYGDSYLLMYGIAASPAEPKSFLLSCGAGAFSSTDCEITFPAQSTTYPKRSNIYQLYVNRCANPKVAAFGGKNDEEDKLTFSTTGIDDVTTYGMRQDPFNANHEAILYTDQGLILSNDGGATWSNRKTHDNRDWTGDWVRTPVTWANTIYDMIFDRYVKGRIYGLWSGRHDAPYATTPSVDSNSHGGFAVANMTDENWESLIVNWKNPDGTKIADNNTSSSTYGEALPGTVLPEKSIPVKFDIVYPIDAASRASGANRTFWVACFGKGFYRSTDSGLTFTEVNDGIADKTDGMVYAADVEVSEDGSQVFGMTARRTDVSGVKGKVYRYDSTAEEWVEIPTPTTTEGTKTLAVTCPRDIFWDEARNTLYISCVASNSQKNASKGHPDFYNHHGGIYVWHPGDAQATPLDASSEAVGDATSIEGVTVDSAGNLFASDSRGSVWLRLAGGTNFQKLYDQFHLISKNVQLYKELVTGNVRTDTVVLPSFGGGTLKLKVTMETEAAETSVTPETADSPETAASPFSAATPATAATPLTAVSPATVATPVSPATPETVSTPATAATPASAQMPATPVNPDAHDGSSSSTPAYGTAQVVGDAIQITTADGKPATGWVETSDGSIYYAVGGVAQTGKQLIGESTYFLADDGKLRTYWWTDRAAGTHHYLYRADDPEPTGAMALSRWLYVEEDSGWYVFDKLGRVLSGWYRDPSTGLCYYLDDRHGEEGLFGKMQSGWLCDTDQKWYYLLGRSDGGEYGTLVIDAWLYQDGEWYYCSVGSGALETGWKFWGGSWYFLSPRHDGGYGMLQRGWFLDEAGDWYLSDPGSGAMRVGWQMWRGQWYHLNEGHGGILGRMDTGWIWSVDAWYYLGDNGAMLENTWTPDGYRVDASGRFVG